MNRTTQAEILRLVVERLRACVPEYTDITCFAADHTTPISFPAGPICCTVTFGAGSFPYYAGGGYLALCEECQMLVTPFIRCKLDKPSQTTQIMLSEEKGILGRWKPAILRALLLDHGAGQEQQAWIPRDADGRELLRSHLAPVSCSAPAPDASGEWMGLIMSFAVSFDWRL